MYGAVLCLIFMAAAPEPQWVQVPQVRSANTTYGSVYADVYSHTRAAPVHGHGIPLAAHELTHDINSDVRNRFAGGTGKWNAAYVLGGRAAVFREPRVTLSQVARHVPRSLRGSEYSTHLIRMQQWWQNEPLFVVDEWSADVNDYAASVELGREISAGLSQAMDGAGYALVLLAVVERNDSNYDRRQLEAFVRWQIERMERLSQQLAARYPQIWQQAGESYLRRFHQSADTEWLRDDVRRRYGGEWLGRMFRPTAPKQIKRSQDPYEIARVASVKSGRPLFVLVGASWCGPCKTVCRHKAQFERQGHYAYVDIDKRPELARVLRVGGAIPHCVVYFRRDGKLYRRDLVGPDMIFAYLSRSK